MSTVEREPVLCAGLDIPCGLHLSTALLMTFVAALDPAEGWLENAMSSLSSSLERITRLEITRTVGQALSWAFFSRWFGMDPADNLNLIPPENPWSGSAWSMYTGLQRTTALPGVTRCRLVRHSTERWCTAPLTIRTPLSQTVVETGETSSQVVQCQSGKKFVVLSRAFSCYTYSGDGKVSFRNIIVECDGTDFAVVVPAPALSYFLCFPTVSEATAPV